MRAVLELPLRSGQAGLWFLGQAGYLIRSGGVTVAIDPYLSDAAAANAPEFARLAPPPIAPGDLKVDLYLVTHDHLDHLDPDTIRAYRHAKETQFIAPRLAARKLVQLGLPPAQVMRLDSAEEGIWRDLSIRGIFALATSADVLDTTGYMLRFPNGRTVYHVSDTAFTPLLLQAAPKGVEVMLVPINGKWGNLNIEQAAELAAAVGPRYVLPCHYDMMALNTENPQAFLWLCRNRKLAAQCVIAPAMQPFIWE